MKRLAPTIAIAVCLAAVASAAPAGQLEARRPLAGRPLTDALRELQARGVKIVFSSELVRPGMRVGTVPAGLNDRALLDAILQPHGLEVREGPRAALIVVRSERGARPASRPGTPEAIIRGVVIDARSAAPLEGVVVRLVNLTGKESTTDANGRFEIGAVPPGHHTVFASLVGYTLARPEVDVVRANILEMTVALAPGAATYTEEVTVTSDPFRGALTSAPSTFVIGSGELLELRGMLTDDPLRAMQAVPTVTAVNDFRSEFSVRGNDYRHIGLSVDGMTIDWPVHSVRDDPAGGSVALFNSGEVDQVTLTAGAYPQDRPAQTGAWVDFQMREGSRERLQVRGALSMTTASLTLEGPIGRNQRGSWLVATRQSFVQWILERMRSNDTTAFGFTDLQAKGVYDVTGTQRVDATLIAGRSLLHLTRNDPDPNLVSSGDSKAFLLTTGWRSTWGSALTSTHRFLATRHSFENHRRDGIPLGRGTGNGIAYRGAVSWMARPSDVIQIGTYLQRDSVDQSMTRYLELWSPPAVVARPEEVRGSRVLGSADARVTHTGARGLALDAGVLISHATNHASSPSPSPWFAVAIPASDTMFVRVAGGLYRQHPALNQSDGTFGRADARAETARHLEVAVEHRWRTGRVQATVYQRREHDMLRLTDNDYRLAGSVLIEPSLAPSWSNALDGTAHGVELLAQRHASTGLSGWIGYSYSRTRYTDRRTSEEFFADFDQRHTFSAYGHHRFSPATSTSVKLRLGSGVPIPGYLEPSGSGDDAIFVGERRNVVRLPTYARLDVRVNRTFNFDDSRLTLFIEIVNVMGRENLAPGYDSMRVFGNGRVISTHQALFPFLPTAGMLVEF